MDLSGQLGELKAHEYRYTVKTSLSKINDVEIHAEIQSVIEQRELDDVPSPNPLSDYGQLLSVGWALNDDVLHKTKSRKQNQVHVAVLGAANSSDVPSAKLDEVKVSLLSKNNDVQYHALIQSAIKPRELDDVQSTNPLSDYDQLLSIDLALEDNVLHQTKSMKQNQVHVAVLRAADSSDVPSAKLYGVKVSLVQAILGDILPNTDVARVDHLGVLILLLLLTYLGKTPPTAIAMKKKAAPQSAARSCNFTKSHGQIRCYFKYLIIGFSVVLGLGIVNGIPISLQVCEGGVAVITCLCAEGKGGILAHFRNSTSHARPFRLCENGLSSWKITNSHLNNSGLYQCICDCGLGSVSSETILQVIGAAECERNTATRSSANETEFNSNTDSRVVSALGSVIDNPISLQACEGDVAVIPCPCPKGKGGILIHFRNSKSHAKPFRLCGSVLSSWKITNSHLNNSGLYQCICDCGLGSVSSETNLQVIGATECNINFTTQRTFANETGFNSNTASTELITTNKPENGMSTESGQPSMIRGSLAQILVIVVAVVWVVPIIA